MSDEVFIFYEKNALSNTFSQDDGMAGRNWLKLFFSRRLSLAVRKPEAVGYSYSEQLVSVKLKLAGF